MARLPKFIRTLDTLWSIDSQKKSKFDATRCQILRPKCTKFDFRWRSAPDPAGEAYSAPTDPRLYLRGLLLREGRGRGKWEEVAKEEGNGREEERSEGMEGEGPPPVFCLEPPLVV